MRYVRDAPPGWRAASRIACMPSHAIVLSTPRADWAAAASSAFSISGGSEMFSMTKLVSVSPSFLNSSAMSPLTTFSSTL